MGVYHQFVRGGIGLLKQKSHLEKLPEERRKTFCSPPSFYANCEVFRAERHSPQDEEH